MYGVSRGSDFWNWPEPPKTRTLDGQKLTVAVDGTHATDEDGRLYLMHAGHRYGMCWKLAHGEKGRVLGGDAT